MSLGRTSPALVSVSVIGLLLGASPARAETYQVGPTRTFDQFSDLPTLRPGDIVQVDGGADYNAFVFRHDGAAGNPIIIRGVRDGSGAMPRIRGGTNTVELMGDHTVFEGFDVSGGSSRCVYHHAHDIVVRGCVIHDCPRQGLLGADTDSGSLLLEHTEIHHAGGGDRDHQVYMSTDQIAHPGSVFRMQFCWIHDGNGGNNVKSRAERNEIYFNWLEGAYYHQLELIGPDPGGTPVAENAHREDSDVVGNVFVMNGGHPTHYVARFGGDATGQSNGRYRFVHNTVVLAATSAGIFRLFDGIESLEASNNVFHQVGAGSAQVVRDAEAAWTMGRRIRGANNWLVTGTGFRDIPPPSEWTGSISGASPGFESVAGNDLRPASGSPLVDAAAASPPGWDFPRPLLAPTHQPPTRAVAVEMSRPTVAALDIGAFELGTGPPVMIPDAGVADTGVPLTDAGAIRDAADRLDTFPASLDATSTDSGPSVDARTVDATTVGDAATAGDARVDAPSMAFASGGCAVRAAGPRHEPTVLLVLFSTLLVIRRRRGAIC